MFLRLPARQPHTKLRRHRFGPPNAGRLPSPSPAGHRLGRSAPLAVAAAQEEARGGSMARLETMQSSFYGALAKAQAALRAGPDAVRAAQDACDEAVAGSPDRARWQCGNGCAHCCRHPVGVTFAEAVDLLAAIDALPEPEAKAVRARIGEGAVRTHATPWHGLGGIACPLLDGSSCGLYHARPLPCRALGSLDADACRRDAEGERVPVPFDAHAHVAGIAVGQALDAATGGKGHRELRSALAAMLRADAAGRALAFAESRPAVGVPTGNGDAR